MKRGVLKFTACALAAGMTFTGTGAVAFASKDTTLAGFGVTEDKSKEEGAPQEVSEFIEPEAPGVTETEQSADTSLNGQVAFAQCEEYINVRSSADTDSEVVGKVYNNGSVTILSQVGDWFEVQSGNAVGYVKADYFATGAEAEAIAQEVAYNVATVYSDALTVRSDASEEADQIGTVYANEELEVVDYSGDWMKVVLGDGSYGYVNAYYVGYDTYFATAETLEEEQARLDQEWLDYLAQQEAEQAAAEQAYYDSIAAQQQAQWDAEWQAQQAQWDAEWQAQQAQWDAAYQAQAQADQAAADAAYQSQITADAQTQAEAAYQEYLNAQAAADAATETSDEQAVIDAAAQAEQQYQEYLNAQAAADAQAQAEADAAYQAQVQAQAAADAQAQAEAAESYTYTEESYTDTSYTDDTYVEDSYTESYSSAGESIVNFATQFVGNPYVWGGTSLTNGADCSGFTQSVMANFGISIPRTAAEQSYSGTPVSLSDIQPGDLLFYEGSGGIGHVTMYMGGGQVVHASNSNTGIIISDYGYRTPVSARRYW